MVAFKSEGSMAVSHSGAKSTKSGLDFHRELLEKQNRDKPEHLRITFKDAEQQAEVSKEADAVIADAIEAAELSETRPEDDGVTPV